MSEEETHGWDELSKGDKTFLGFIVIGMFTIVGLLIFVNIMAFFDCMEQTEIGLVEDIIDISKNSMLVVVNGNKINIHQTYLQIDDKICVNSCNKYSKCMEWST